MFQYGLVGNTIFYGILVFGFGSIGNNFKYTSLGDLKLVIRAILEIIFFEFWTNKAWELDKISDYAVKLDDKLAKEVLGYANMEKIEAHKKKDMTNNEMRNAAQKMQLKGSLQSLEEKFEVKDDFDTGKDADI